MTTITTNPNVHRAPGVQAFVSAQIANWRQRREERFTQRTLGKLSNHIRADIGLSPRVTDPGERALMNSHVPW